jgi:hypothetical protein
LNRWVELATKRNYCANNAALFPIRLRQFNLLMVVSVVLAINNILMGHIGLYGYQEFGKTVLGVVEKCYLYCLLLIGNMIF